MKNRSFISILVGLLAASFMATSCDDVLTPELKRYSENYAQDSVYSAFGILKRIQAVGERSVLLDAARSDLSTTGTYTNDSILDIANFNNPEDGSSKLLNIADYYHIINSCNFYIARVDTNLTKNGASVFKREYAQVQSLRAWTYIQLVRYYGSIPFVTEPIENSSQADNLEKNAPRITKDNVASLLVEAGLGRALELQKRYNMPDYGSLDAGISIPSKQCFVPVQISLAEAFLMQGDYAAAAEYYYDYFRYMSASDKNSDYMVDSYGIKDASNAVVGYMLNPSQWANCYKNLSTSEHISVIPGASNKTNGDVISDVAVPFGFKSTAYEGNISMAANEEYQQILPSNSYVSLNKEQKFCMWSSPNDVVKIEYVDGDGRLEGSAPNYEFTKDVLSRIISKNSPTNSFRIDQTGVKAYGFSPRYFIPMFRKSQIYLHFAEAINRLGFPQIAFGVLKDGLIRQNFPTLAYGDFNKYYMNPENNSEKLGILKDVTTTETVTSSTGEDSLVTVTKIDTLYFADGYTADSTIMNVPYFSASPQAFNGGMYYLSVDEMVKAQAYPFLNFWSDDTWNKTSAENKTYGGIHSRGCGDVGGIHDSIYTYARMVAKKIAETRARLGNLSYEEQVALENTLCVDDVLQIEAANITDEEIIDAVENLIIDESALETAFEGHRFSDLVRVASHKGGQEGRNWLAWKVARRNYNVNTNANEYDAQLYNKLSNGESYWYFALPVKR